MLHIVFIEFFLLGAVVDRLVVYFLHKYKDYAPKVLQDTAMLFFIVVWGDMFLSPDLTAYIKAKGLVD